MQENTNNDATAETARKFRNELFRLLADLDGRRKRVDVWRISSIRDQEAFRKHQTKVCLDWSNRERELDEFDADSEEVEDVRAASEIYHQTLISNWKESEENRTAIAAPALKLLEEAEARFRAAKDDLPKWKG